MRKCFVISPIGDEGTETRKHADTVFNYIIKPAMKECDVEPRRADQLARPGQLSDQMLQALLTDDFCIAILTGHNPNVYYELAIAQAAARPVITLLARDQRAPFNTSGLRTVFYDLEVQPVVDGVYRDELIKQVKGLEANGWQAADILAGFGVSVGEKLSGVTTFDSQAKQWITSEGLDTLLSSARQRLDLAGMNLSFLRDVRDVARRLEHLVNDGCRIRILLMDPTNPVLDYTFNPAIPEMIPEMIRNDIRIMTEFFAKIARNRANMEVRHMQRALGSMCLMCSDVQAVWWSYLFSERPHNSPLWACRRGSRLYDVMTREFEALWAANATDG